MTFLPQVKKEIIIAAQKGNLKAFEQILFTYEKLIFNYILRLSNNRQEAEDLTQETFIKVYRFLNQADPEKDIKPWIYKIATNTFYDWLRKKRKLTELPLLDESINENETNDSQASYKLIEQAKDIEEALEKIKPSYKAILLLYFYQDLNYQEISETLSLPMNTVKTNLSRAKKSLKKILNGFHL